MKLDFRNLELSDFDRVYSYMSVYGEGSCQHSFVSMYSTKEKYRDMICEKDGFLFTLRSGLCDEIYRVYMAPFGNGDIRAAFEAIFDDAAAYGRKVRFFTVTEKYALLLDDLFPGRFEITENEDYAEYIYEYGNMSTFDGPALRKRRAEIRTFQIKYGERARCSIITHDDFPEIVEYEKKWLSDCAETHDMDSLNKEARMIFSQLDEYDRLRLNGITLRIDGKLCGFCYGTMLDSLHYDVIIEKADREIPHAYKMIRLMNTRMCVPEGGFVNMEEDIGVPGLRAIKQAYKPDVMLRKYVAKERG